MTKLLYSGFRRYTKNPLFYFAIVAALILGVLSGVRVMEDYTLDDVYIIAGFVIFAILLSLMIGREFSDGAFRNKIICGHTKGKIFLSEYIIALTVCMSLCLISAAVFACFNASLFSRIPSELLVRSVVGVTLLVISMITIIIAVCMLISRKAVVAIVAIVLVLGSYLAAYTVKSELDRPEYYSNIIFIDGRPVRDEETLEKNPNYIDSPLREQYMFICYVLPYGQMLEYMDMVSPLFDPINITLFVGDEDMQILKMLPLYSIGTIIAVGTAGYIAFRRKQIK